METAQGSQLNMAQPRPPTSLTPLRDICSVPMQFIDNEEELQRMAAELRQYSEIAVDLEESSQHSYIGFICLMQISTREKDYLIDTIALKPSLHKHLSVIFSDNKIIKIFFGCHSDIGWLQRDFNLFVENCFDLQVLLQEQLVLTTNIGHNKPNLSNALLTQLNVTMDSTHQLADWRQRPFDAWSAGMKDYARMNTNYLLPLYDKLLHDLAVPANCTAHVIEQVHAESNKLARRSYKPITVKDRVARWMKKCLNELRELYPSSEASEMHHIILRKLLECREMAAKHENILPEGIARKVALVNVTMSWERINNRDALTELLRPGSLFADKYASSFYRSFLAAKHEYYLMRNMHNVYSADDELRAKVSTVVERKGGAYESKASTIKAVVAEYTRDVSKTSAPLFTFRQQQDKSGRQMFLSHATFAMADGSSLEGSSEVFQYNKKAAEKLAALDLTLKLIERQHMTLTANIVAEVNAFVAEKMLFGTALAKSIENVFSAHNVQLLQPITPTEDNTAVKAAVQVERPLPVVIPTLEAMEVVSVPTTPPPPSGTKRRVDGSPVSEQAMAEVTVHCKACGATICPVTQLAFVPPHITIAELHHESVIGADKSLKTREVTDEKERAMKPFKLICAACDKPVGSMIRAEKDAQALPLFKGVLIALKRGDVEVSLERWKATARNSSMGEETLEIKAKKQKTEHVSPTRPTVAVEEVQPQSEATVPQSRDYHVYQLDIDQAEVMAIFADHEARTKPKAVLLLSTDVLCWNNYRMRGKIPALSHTITQYDLRVKYMERVTLTAEQFSTVKTFHKQWMDYALEGMPKNNPSLFASPDAVLFTPWFAQSAQLIDTEKLNSLMAHDNALNMLHTYVKQYTLGAEHRPIALSDIASAERSAEWSESERDVLQSVKLSLRKELSGRIIQANYSKTSYIVIDVNFNLTPLSSFSKSTTESIQYLEYFKNKGQEITDLSQPLVSVSIKALDRINRTAADQSHKFIASTEPDINLVPELCSIFGLTAEIRALSKLFPALLIHVNDTRAAFNKIAVLEESLGYTIHSPQLKKRIFTSLAFSEQCEVEPDNYQLLEHLGDAVLEFLVTAALLHKFPKFSEDQLINKRAQIVSNKRLGEISDQLKLASYLIVPKKVSAHLADRSKVSADLLEAFIGALYLDQGLESCVSFCNRYLFTDAIKTSFEHLTAPPFNDQFDALPLTPAQESSLHALLPQFTNRNVLVQALTHPSMFVRPSLTHPMSYEEAQGKLGRIDCLKFKVLGYSLLKFVLTAHLFHCDVTSDFQLAVTGRTRSVEETHHIIRAAYLLPSVLGHLARNVLQLDAAEDGPVLYNFNVSAADLMALEEFQSFGDQFNPRARPQFLAWIKAQWHATGETVQQRYSVPEHAQMWADLYSAFIGARYLDRGLFKLDTCHACWDIEGGAIHEQLLSQLPPVTEVDPKNDVLQLLMRKTGHTALKLQYKRVTADQVDQSFIASLTEPVRVDLGDQEALCGVYFEHLCLGLGTGPTVKLAEKSAALNCLQQFSDDSNVTCFVNRLRCEDVARTNCE